MPDHCPVCGDKEAEGFPVAGDRAGFRCRVCGRFAVTGTALRLLQARQYEADSYRLSGAIRAASSSDRSITLTTENIGQLIATTSPPSTPLEAIDRLILLVHQYLPSLVDTMVIYDHDYPLILARSTKELQGLLKLARDTGVITLDRDPQLGPHSWVCGLTLEGWRRVAELRRTGQASDQAFVAMWFNTELEPAYSEGIHPALTEAGYRAVRVDKEPHNEKIDDRIIAEIRRSGLVVADVTGNRGGVYFEAGFALGLGLPVIWAVRADTIDSLHFDTRQYNHVTWSTPGELREKLYYRVMATMGPARPSVSRP